MQGHPQGAGRSHPSIPGPRTERPLPECQGDAKGLGFILVEGIRTLRYPVLYAFQEFFARSGPAGPLVGRPGLAGKCRKFLESVLRVQTANVLRDGLWTYLIPLRYAWGENDSVLIAPVLRPRPAPSRPTRPRPAAPRPG